MANNTSPIAQARQALAFHRPGLASCGDREGVKERRDVHGVRGVRCTPWKAGVSSGDADAEVRAFSLGTKAVVAVVTLGLNC